MIGLHGKEEGVPNDNSLFCFANSRDSDDFVSLGCFARRALHNFLLQHGPLIVPPKVLTISTCSRQVGTSRRIRNHSFLCWHHRRSSSIIVPLFASSSMILHLESSSLLPTIISSSKPDHIIVTVAVGCSDIYVSRWLAVVMIDDVVVG